MSSFTKPKLIRYATPGTVLTGGRSLVELVVSGWGLLTVHYWGPLDSKQRRRVFLSGGERCLDVAVFPPCKLTISLVGLFDSSTRSIELQVDAVGVARLPAPDVWPLPQIVLSSRPGSVVLPPPHVKLPGVQVRFPEARSFTAPRIYLGPISIKKLPNEGDQHD